VVNNYIFPFPYNHHLSIIFSGCGGIPLNALQTVLPRAQDSLTTTETQQSNLSRLPFEGNLAVVPQITNNYNGVCDSTDPIILEIKSQNPNSTSTNLTVLRQTTSSSTDLEFINYKVGHDDNNLFFYDNLLQNWLIVDRNEFVGNEYRITLLF